MSGRVKVRDCSAIADRARSAVKYLSGFTNPSDVPEWAVSVLVSEESQDALFGLLDSADDRIAAAALAALSVQHLSGMRLDTTHLHKADEAALRLFEPLSERSYVAHNFSAQVVALSHLAELADDRPCVFNESSFLSGLTHFGALMDVMYQASTGTMPATSAWERVGKMGAAAVRWGAALQVEALVLASPERRAELVYECAEAMLRSGCDEDGVGSVLGSMVLTFPDAADALLATLDFKHECLAVHLLIRVCSVQPSACSVDVVTERTSDISWRRTLKRLRTVPADGDERLTLVRSVALNHLVGRDVSGALEPMLELHPTNMDMAASHDADVYVAREIEALVQELGRELVPTRLGLAS